MRGDVCTYIILDHIGLGDLWLQWFRDMERLGDLELLNVCTYLDLLIQQLLSRLLIQQLLSRLLTGTLRRHSWSVFQLSFRPCGWYTLTYPDKHSSPASAAGGTPSPALLRRHSSPALLDLDLQRLDARFGQTQETFETVLDEAEEADVRAEVLARGMSLMSSPRR